jgi:hypothetical protein
MAALAASGGPEARRRSAAGSYSCRSAETRSASRRRGCALARRATSAGSAPSNSQTCLTSCAQPGPQHLNTSTDSLRMQAAGAGDHGTRVQAEAAQIWEQPRKGRHTRPRHIAYIGRPRPAPASCLPFPICLGHRGARHAAPTWMIQINPLKHRRHCQWKPVTTQPANQSQLSR